MKTGSSLQSVAERVVEQHRSARDFLAPMKHIRVNVVASRPQLVLDDGAGAMAFDIADPTHEQLASTLDIPLPYYRRLVTEAPELLAQNANTWLGRGGGRRLVRTIRTSQGGTQVRAFLSDRFRPLDNASLLEAMLPELQAVGAQVVSCELTDRRLYLKCVSHRVADHVRVGEVVQAGVVLCNSDTGWGSVSVQPLIWTCRCTNGLVLEDLSLRAHHVGRRHGGEVDAVQHLVSDETRVADDRAFFLRVRDVARAAMSADNLRQQVERLRQAAADSISPVAVERLLEFTSQRFGLTEEERGGVLSHLVAGGDLSRWGLCSAVTRMSQDVEQYERASVIERIGGRIIEMPRHDWTSLMKAN